MADAPRGQPAASDRDEVTPKSTAASADSAQVLVDPTQLRVERAHAAAAAAAARFYLDPRSGFRVMTELHHRARGFCCGSACRHCPYDWANVDGERFEQVAEARAERRVQRAAYARALRAEALGLAAGAPEDPGAGPAEER